jgi:hypothetical protein
MEYVQPDSWITVKVFPAMVMVPLWAVPVFSATEYSTVPLPVPLDPEVMVIQDALFVAVQEQALSEAVTFTLPVPPEAGCEAL